MKGSDRVGRFAGLQLILSAANTSDATSTKMPNISTLSSFSPLLDFIIIIAMVAAIPQVALVITEDLSVMCELK